APAISIRPARRAPPRSSRRAWRYRSTGAPSPSPARSAAEPSATRPPVSSRSSPHATHRTSRFGCSVQASEPPSPERFLRAVGKHDVAVLVEPEARVVGHLPRMAVEVEEHSRVAAVERLRRLACDLRPVRAGLLDHLVHLLARAEVVREGDATPAGAVVRDPAVLRELVASPQHEDAAIGLEEARLLDVHRGRPAQCLVESLRSPVIRYAERHQADPLPHGEAEPTG